MIDKMIHKDEFRLRMLLTNQCNKHCSFCLNDFQPKEPKAHIHRKTALECLKAYGNFMKSIGEKSIVTFSGGEPGIYNWLDLLLKHARYYCDVVKVVTNGTALKHKRDKYVDCWHVGVTYKDYKIKDFARSCTKNVIAQLVVTENTSYIHLMCVIRFYLNAGIKVKLFADFNSEKQEYLRERIESLIDHFGEGVYTRFTGEQKNRGAACTNCNRKCVTLKALWVFPDGSSSTCPQGHAELFKGEDWHRVIKKAYEAHLYRDSCEEIGSEI